MDAFISHFPAFVTQNPLPSAFLFLVLFCFITPLSEELALVLVGMSLHSTGVGFLPLLAMALPALLIQDSFYFFAARLLGPRIIRHRFLAPLIKPRTIENAERYFSRRGPAIVFWSRFVVGLRSAVILGSGILGMRWATFIRYDSFAALLMTPAWLFVGYILGAQFGEQVGHLTRVLGVIAPLAIVAGGVLVFRGVKADQARATEGP